MYSAKLSNSHSSQDSDGHICRQHIQFADSITTSQKFILGHGMKGFIIVVISKHFISRTHSRQHNCGHHNGHNPIMQHSRSGEQAFPQTHLAKTRLSTAGTLHLCHWARHNWGPRYGRTVTLLADGFIWHINSARGNWHFSTSFGHINLLGQGNHPTLRWGNLPTGPQGRTLP